MLGEFFCSRQTFLFAWVGTVAILAYSFYIAWFRREMNSWYGNFYDLLGDAASSAGTNTSSLRDDAEEEIVALLVLIGPVTALSPFVRWLRSRFAFSWRMALIRSYLLHTWPKARSVEGSSQRMQEDTARFAVGLSGAVSLALDTVLSLVVFVPVLLDLGAEAPSPPSLRSFGDSWLFVVAFGAAVVGLLGSLLTGWPLVGLEVSNQVVEADFRKRLVLSEVGTASPGVPEDQFLSHAAAVLPRMRANYTALYCAFFRLNLWLGVVEQAAVLIPIVVLTPQLFATDPAERLQLGTMIRTSDAFQKVFGALSVLSDHWGHINEWISVIRRLREFEGRRVPSFPVEVPTTELVSDVAAA
jgi:peptide/bleomycin uptake transporter